MLDELVLTADEPDARGHVVQQPERVVPGPALVERRVDQQPGGRIEGVDPALGQHVEVVGELMVADVTGHAAVQW